MREETIVRQAIGIEGTIFSGGSYGDLQGVDVECEFKDGRVETLEIGFYEGRWYLTDGDHKKLAFAETLTPGEVNAVSVELYGGPITMRLEFTDGRWWLTDDDLFAKVLNDRVETGPIARWQVGR